MSPMTDLDLDRLRARLDRVDASLVRALARRQRLVGEVARFKSAGSGHLRDLAREEDVLTTAAAGARAAGLDSFFVVRLFREILDHSLRTQQAALAPPRAAGTRVVGFQGGEGAYSHLVAQRHFGARAGDHVYRGFETFEEMLDGVRTRALDYAVLPVENSATGTILEAYDLLARLDVAVVAEEIVTVEHCLVG
jgi:chorismate mutase/prephenate dehydratase